MKSPHNKTIHEVVGRNPIHPFPARMAPGIALEILEKEKGSLRVLDPMMGSGTVLAVARARGHQAIGIDIDPLAVLISKVWTSTLEPKRILLKAGEVLSRAKTYYEDISIKEAYPPAADVETKKFIRYWFDPDARRQLGALALAITRLRNSATRDALWCAFSRLIIVKQAGASRAMDLAHSRPHLVYKVAPIKPFEKFLQAVNYIVKNSIWSNTKNRGPAPQIKQGDARCLPLQKNSIDVVLTSPPYLNAIDYMRCSKFTLVWMGYSVDELRMIRKESIGAEIGKISENETVVVNKILSGLNLNPELSAKNVGILQHYIEDMFISLKQVSHVLRPNGKAIYVIGENTIKGTFIPNSLIVSRLAALTGLKKSQKRSRTLPQNRRYLPPPKHAKDSMSMNARMRKEVILTFRKCA